MSAIGEAWADSWKAIQTLTLLFEPSTY